MLPEYGELKDTEVRYRKKYLDLMMNADAMEVLKVRAGVFRELRTQLEAQGYV